MKALKLEYVLEAVGLGAFMVSACAFTTLLEHPASPLRQAIASGDLRRALVGVAMGLTAIAIIYSRWGMRSGAHLNPSATLAFLRLGRIAPRDAAGYIVAQFVGGAAGVLLSRVLLGVALADPAVRYAVTVPGSAGVAAAFATELAMTFVLFTVVLRANAAPRLMRWTGAFAGVLVAFFIATLGPLSGMSLNPARSFASASVANVWTGFWLYLVAPPLGMQLAAELHRRVHPRPHAGCAKLHHGDGPCLFCEHQHGPGRAPGSVPSIRGVPSSYST